MITAKCNNRVVPWTLFSSPETSSRAMAVILLCLALVAQALACNQAIFTIESAWEGGYIGKISIKGFPAPSTISFSFNQPTTVSSIWNAQIVSSDNGVVTVRTSQWSDNTFGFQADGAEQGLPENFFINGEPCTDAATEAPTAPPQACPHLDFKVSSQWAGGFVASVKLSAEAAKNEVSWAWRHPTNVANFWNANLISVVGSTVTFKPDGAEFGLQGAAGSDVSIHDIKINGLACADFQA
eukprot:m.220107 g.220107  ORF g.220107 m.220107 type:complete len:240 (-) comp10312_c0_seq1:70-789(-)